MHYNLAPCTAHEDNMYECSIHCYTQAELADITRIGVVGTGAMGAGIAEVFAEAGYEVL